MANSLLTIDMITREAIMLFRNSNAFIQNLDRQYDDQFANDGAKIGFNLRIRLPNDYVVRTGAAMSVQDTERAVHHPGGLHAEGRRRRLLDRRAHHAAGRLLRARAGPDDQQPGRRRGGDDHARRRRRRVQLRLQRRRRGRHRDPDQPHRAGVGRPALKRSAPNAGRNLVTDPFTMAHMVETMQGLFNPSTTISKQYDTAQIYKALNYKWFEDQTVLVHTTGTFTAGTVNGAGQTGTNLVTNAITGTFKAGDIITLAGVNSVNRVTKADDGMLQQFVVTANVANGATAVPIYPAIIPPNAMTGASVQYQTVTASRPTARPCPWSTRRASSTARTSPTRRARSPW
jgi:hypothetical protein